jgi:glycosyltransferase involved in cell wall biosynthesis
MTIEGKHTSVLAHETAAHRSTGAIGGGVGGAGHAVYSETAAINDQGIPFTLITAEPNRHMQTLRDYPFPTVGIHLPEHSSNEELIALLSQDTKVRELFLEKMRHPGFDVGHFVTGIGLLIDLHRDIGSIEEKQQRKLLGRLHSPYYETMLRYNPSYQASDERRRQEKAVLRNSDGVIFSTMAEAEETARLAAANPDVDLTEEEILSKVIVAGLGTEHEIFNPSMWERNRQSQLRQLLGDEIAESNPIVFGINGRIHPERSVYNAVAACTDFMTQDQNGNYHVLVTGAAGKGLEGQEELERIHTHLEELPNHIANRIHLVGVIPYDRAFAAVNIALNTTPYETWGFYTLEAAAAGIPLIIAENPVTRHLLNGNGLYLQDNSRSSISVALYQATRQLDDMQQTAHDAHRHVQQFTWEKTAQDLISGMKRLQ